MEVLLNSLSDVNLSFSKQYKKPAAGEEGMGEGERVRKQKRRMEERKNGGKKV
jgi:hypothetical protein